MSLFDWFSRKAPAAAPPPAESSGLGHVDATQPLSGGRTKGLPVGAGGTPANRKTERLERREHLYRVVRDAMTKAGVLTASYKFKVLSLDQHGRQYLIMMDLAHEFAGATGRLAEIEALIAQSAKTRHDILVTAVYWRVNEMVTVGLSKMAGPTVAPAAAVVPTAPASPVAAAPNPASSAAAASSSASSAARFEPLQADEVAAFKQALASAVPVHTPLANSGEIVRSGRRNPVPQDFVDTEVAMDDKNSPLSGTQYGDLMPMSPEPRQRR